MADLQAGIALTERLEFTVATPMAHATALEFVRRAELSLAAANVLEDVHVQPGPPTLLSAYLPISTPLFGRRRLRFVSELVETAAGAALVATEPVTGAQAWADVGGEAVVTPSAAGSDLRYVFDMTVHLDIPDADRWGTKALTRMIELTAGTVLRSLAARLRAGIQTAAATYSGAVGSDRGAG